MQWHIVLWHRFPGDKLINKNNYSCSNKIMTNCEMKEGMHSAHWTLGIAEQCECTVQTEYCTVRLQHLTSISLTQPAVIKVSLFFARSVFYELSERSRPHIANMYCMCGKDDNDNIFMFENCLNFFFILETERFHWELKIHLKKCLKYRFHISIWYRCWTQAWVQMWINIMFDLIYLFLSLKLCHLKLNIDNEVKWVQCEESNEEFSLMSVGWLAETHNLWYDPWMFREKWNATEEWDKERFMSNECWLH